MLIANVIQNVAVGTQPTDSAFLVFGKDTNFGNGTQKIRIQKSYSTPADPKTGAKPLRTFVDAYELTVQVNAALSVLPVLNASQENTPLPGKTPLGGIPVVPAIKR